MEGWGSHLNSRQRGGGLFANLFLVFITSISRNQQQIFALDTPRSSHLAAAMQLKMSAAMEKGGDGVRLLGETFSVYPCR